MTWFKVDDGAWAHKRFIRLSTLAFGVWARMGSYCAHELTDGLVELDLVHHICPEPPEVIDAAIAELTAAKLWELVPDDPGARRYHDWHEYQPTKAEVQRRRQEGAERIRRYRERKRAGTDAPTPE